ncbi:MAG: hypothetical protein HGB36_08830 [Chlorobiaceae bacterium]|nr:hypothetical protein [Chlorobiaceae bacterium]
MISPIGKIRFREPRYGNDLTDRAGMAEKANSRSIASLWKKVLIKDNNVRDTVRNASGGIW